MIRFFTAPHDVTASNIKLSEGDFEHIRVLRLRPDELFTVCDGNGTDYICRLSLNKNEAIADIVKKQKSLGEPSVKCRVFIAYSKGDRLDYAVQKSVELGAYEIILFESGRCVAVPRDIPKKTTRLQRIALETAKQSNRGILPKVTSAGKFDMMIEEATRHSELSLMFYECEDDLHIKPVLEQHFYDSHGQKEQNTKPISVITGPEGGFEPDEVVLAQSKGIRIVSLGPRILRSETAPVVALSAIMFHTGNL